MAGVAKWARQPGWFQALLLHWCCGSAASLFGLHGATKVGLAACFKFYRRKATGWPCCGFFRQTGHNEAFCAVAASGCWQVACVGVHTGACIVGCSLKQPASPPARHTLIFRLFSKICSAFSGFAGYKSKNSHTAHLIFVCGNALAKAWALECKIALLYTRTNSSFNEIFTH